MPRNKGRYYLVLDAGTTGVKAFVFDKRFRIVARATSGLKRRSPRKHYVEQNPAELVTKSIAVLRRVVRASGAKKNDFVGFGLANQRETVIAWDKRDGRPVYPAIVWQDNRTAAFCRRLARRHAAGVLARTGLPLVPYFSASKIRWVLDNVPQAAALAAKGALAVGTVDTWLMWNMARPHVYATDHTNASRTLLFNIKKLRWDPALLRIFGIPKNILPEILPSRSRWGTLDPRILGFPLPILAVCGDQQASLFAAGSRPGTTKVTYGTGAFFMQILGLKFGHRKGFFTTIAVSGRRPVFAIEAKVAMGAAEVARVLHKPAALRRVTLQIVREVGKITARLPEKPERIIVDGGITKYKHLPEMQAAASGAPVVRQSTYDGTALGVAKLMLGSRAKLG